MPRPSFVSKIVDFTFAFSQPYRLDFAPALNYFLVCGAVKQEEIVTLLTYNLAVEQSCALPDTSLNTDLARVRFLCNCKKAENSPIHQQERFCVSIIIP